MKNFGKACIVLSACIVFAFAGCNNYGGDDSPQVVPVSGVTLNKSTLTLDVDTSEKLIATVSPDNASDKSVKWLSSDMEIVTVTEDGTVKAVSDGTGSSGDTATVTVRTTDGAKTASCTVKVGPAGTVVPVEGIALDNTALMMQKGEKKKITATVLPRTATDTTVSWSVSGSSVSLSASTGSSVTVTAKDGGTATVTAQAGNKTASCTITVEEPLSVRVTRADGSRYTVSEIDKLDLTKESDRVDIAIFGAWLNSDVSTLGSKIKDSNANVSLDMTAAIGITKIVSGFFRGCFQNCAKLTNIRLPVSVTEIQSQAFSGCTALGELTLGTGVTKIAYDALVGCTGLKNFSISDGTLITGGYYASRLLKDCTNLESVTVTHTDGNTTGIVQKMFAGKNIKTLVVSDGVPKIGGEMFENCVSLTTVSVAGSVQSIGRRAFAGCAALSNLTLNDGLETIGSSAFNGCAALTDITIPDSVRVIDESAFNDCSALTTATLAKNLTALGSNSFAGCGALKTVVFSEAGGSGTLTVGDRAFVNCSALTDISLPASVTKVGVRAFEGCTSLESISIYDLCTTDDFYLYDNDEPLYKCPKLNKAVVRHAEGNTEGRQTKFFYQSAVKEVVIEEGVTSISKEAFAYCKNLTAVTIPSTVEKIGESAFGFCEKLTAVTLPKKLSELGGRAFYKCTALSSLKMNDSQLSVLHESVFGGCSALTAVTLPAGIISIGANAFSNCTKLDIETLPPNLQKIGKEAFLAAGLKKVILPDTVTSIGEKAFYCCETLKTVSIGKGAVTVGEEAFRGCPALDDLTISESAENRTLEDHAFGGCKSLSAVVIPNKVTVKDNVFLHCTGLRSITLGKDTVVEGKYGTAGFPDNIEVHFTGTLADWCNEATRIDTLSRSYSLYVMSNNKDTLVEDISDSTLKDVVFIRDCAFQNCKSVKMFNHRLVESITHFGKSAFANASSITYFDLQMGISSEFRITYTWYKTEDKAVWKASDVSKAEKIDYLANLDLGSPEKAFPIYNKDAGYYWFAVKNPE